MIVDDANRVSPRDNPRPAPVPRRRFVVGMSLLGGAAVLAVFASFLPWLAASDAPHVERSGWDLFETFGLHLTRTLPQTMYTGPVAVAAGLFFVVGAALLVIRHRVGVLRRLLLVLAIGIVGASTHVLLGMWRNVREMSRAGCGCDPDPAVVLVHDRYGIHLIGVAAILAIVGLAVCTVPGPAPHDNSPRSPLGW